MKKFNYTIGIDEVGRGPIAGPVTVAVVLVRNGRSSELFDGIRDSKKLSEKKREKWFGVLHNAKQTGYIDYRVASVTAKNIDLFGINSSIQSSLNRCLSQLNVEGPECLVLLDGGLNAPRKFSHQRSIIKGDEKENIISAASVIAKVIRDRKMVQYGRQFPEYGFEKHKGYGTKHHFGAVKKYGMTVLHRRSFIHLEK